MKWAGRGFWAVVDQVLFAGANFLVSLLLARWLEPTAYGAFSTAYALFLLLGVFHTALWTEPMLIYGSGRFREAFGSYQAVLIRYHWRFAFLVALGFSALGAGLWWGGQRELAHSFLGLAFAAPAVLYLWLVRRGAYVLLDPRLSALGAASYLLVYLGLVGLLARGHLLDEFLAFLIMALAAWLVAEVVRRLLLPRADRAPFGEGEVFPLHWSYGRWSLLAGVFSWTTTNAYFVFLPVFCGITASAQFKALLNLIMPPLHLNGALAQLLVPGMVRAKSKGSFKRMEFLALGLFVSLALSYWLALLLWGPELMGWIYGYKYEESAGWIIWLGLQPVLGAWTVVKVSSLRAWEKARLVAMVYAVGAGVTLLIGSCLAWIGGLMGAVFGLLISQGLMAFVATLLVGRLRG